MPKDGPSAGITMATCIASALTKIPVKKDVAMTGEITLRGRVLAIGGLKEKLLAAKLAGIKTVLIPKQNVMDLKKVSQEVTEGLDIIPVEHADDVLRHALDLKQPEKFLLGKGKRGSVAMIQPLELVRERAAKGNRRTGVSVRH